MLAIRRLAGADMPAVTAIVRGLPDYFTGDVPGLIERDAAGHDSWVLTDSGHAAGFAVATRRPPDDVEILWIAVDPARAVSSPGREAGGSWAMPGRPEVPSAGVYLDAGRACARALA
jgi:hypothetical protein